MGEEDLGVVGSEVGEGEAGGRVVAVIIRSIARRSGARNKHACTEHERYPMNGVRFIQSFYLANWPSNVLGINAVCLPLYTASICAFVPIPIDGLVGALLHCLARLDLIRPCTAIGWRREGVIGRFY